MLKPRVDILLEEYESLKEENQRLNNVLNELEKWLKSNDEHFAEAIPFRETLRKLNELKESDK